MFNVYRDYIKVEHDLQNHRSTWHLAMQAFLFTTLGVIGTWQIGKGMPDNLRTERDFLPYILMIAGCLIAIAAYISIDAANVAIRTLCARWETQSRIEFDVDFIDRVPGIKGGGSKRAELLGKVTSLYIPIIVFSAWVSVFVMYHVDKTRDASPKDQNPETQSRPQPQRFLSRFISVSTTTHADIALDTVTGAYCKTWDWQSQKPTDKNPIYGLKTCDKLYQELLKKQH
jgi:hypothetical protein